MNPQRTLLLLAIACCLADLFAGFLKNQHARELKILIKVCNSPSVTEGLIRYLYWDLALFDAPFVNRFTDRRRCRRTSGD